MYRGFNIDIGHDSEPDYAVGLKKTSAQKENINKELSEFLSPDGVLDGAKLEGSWFPQIDADIFISHSHSDEKLAITLAGWLYIQFGLESFIDSSIWGYSDFLLRKIDNKYCMNNEGATYSYEKRNFSTSHVHIMLCTALSKMMDNTECLFFLNTPNSISSSSIVNQNETNSPWLYYEIGMSSLIRKPLHKHTSRKELIKAKTFSELNEAERKLQIKYPLQTEHLKKVTGADLVKWRNVYEGEIPRATYPLDKLYELF